MTVPGTSPGPDPFGGDPDTRVALEWVGNGEVPPSAPGNYGRLFTFQGRTRYYEVHLPTSYKTTNPPALVIVLHGGSGFPTLMRFVTGGFGGTSGMDELSDTEGFIVVYPAGTGTQGYDRRLFWNTGFPMIDPAQAAVNDVEYMRFVLDDCRRYFYYNPRKVYVTGISNGATMCYKLAVEMPARIAAIAPVAGHTAAYEFPHYPALPFSVVQFSGALDPFNLYNGGPGGLVSEVFLPRDHESVANVETSWQKIVGCPTTVLGVQIGQAISRSHPNGATYDTEIANWTLLDGGHAWPGGNLTALDVLAGSGHLNTDIDACARMWAFFQRHRR